MLGEKPSRNLERSTLFHTLECRGPASARVRVSGRWDKKLVKEEEGTAPKDVIKALAFIVISFTEFKPNFWQLVSCSRKGCDWLAFYLWLVTIRSWLVLIINNQ